MGIIVINPKKTLPISITGEICNLQCDHCKGHYLKGMIPLSQIERKLRSNNYKSILVSGGFDSNGKLPFIPKNLLRNLKEKGFKLNYHLGLINEGDINNIMGIVDEISFDITIDEEIIQNIFHLKKTAEEFKSTFRLLKEIFSVSPHIVLGLNKGKVEKEYEAIEFLSKFHPSKIIFIIFTPIKNTPLEHINPPNIKRIQELFLFTINKIPKAKLYLGCVRPSGDYREEIDLLAFELGFRGIVNPSPKVLEHLKRYNLIEEYFDECCAFLK